MVAYDAYTMTQTSFARVGHITRNVSLGQILVTRESTGKGDSVTPLGLAADPEGPVYAAQSPECSIDHQDNMKVGWYDGDSAFLVISADFKNRTQQNVFTKQGGSYPVGVAVGGKTDRPLGHFAGKFITTYLSKEQTKNVENNMLSFCHDTTRHQL